MFLNDNWNDKIRLEVLHKAHKGAVKWIKSIERKLNDRVCKFNYKWNIDKIVNWQSIVPRYDIVAGVFIESDSDKFIDEKLETSIRWDYTLDNVIEERFEFISACKYVKDRILTESSLI
jgi:hypothetical protein